jgi:hypothetical protein
LKKFSHCRENWVRYDQKCTLVSCKVPIILVQFQWKLNFLTHFQKILKFQISQKSIQWEPSCSMWTDRHINRHDIACCHL